MWQMIREGKFIVWVNYQPVRVDITRKPSFVAQIRESSHAGKESTNEGKEKFRPVKPRKGQRNPS
jgi:hypothetical protein